MAAGSEYTITIKAKGGDSVRAEFAKIATGLDREFAKAEKTVSDFEHQVDKLGKSGGSRGGGLFSTMASAATGFGTALVVANQGLELMSKAFGALGGAASSAFDLFAGMSAAADELGDLAAKVGVSGESLSVFRLAAEASGTSLQGVAAGMRLLSRNFEEANAGSEKAAKAFADLGINVKEAAAAGISTEDLFGRAAEALGKMGDGTRKTALAMQVFGKAGTELLPLMNAIAQDGFAALREEAEKFGFTFSKGFLASSDEFQDNLVKLSSAFTGVKVQLAEGFVPELAKISTSLVDVVKNAGIADGTLKEFGRSVAEAIKPALEGAVQAIENFVKQAKSDGIGTALKNLLSTAFEGAKDTAISIGQKIGEAIADGVLSGLAGSASRAKTAAYDWYKGLFAGIEDFAERHFGGGEAPRFRIPEVVVEGPVRIEPVGEPTFSSVDATSDGGLGFPSKAVLINEYGVAVDEVTTKVGEADAAIAKVGVTTQQWGTQFKGVETAVIRVGDLIADAFEDALDGVIQGTLHIGDTLKSFGISIGKQLFSGIIREKLDGLDIPFKGNIAGLGKDVISTLGGAFTSVFSFAGNALGGIASAFGSLFSGGGFSGFVGGLGSIFSGGGSGGGAGGAGGGWLDKLGSLISLGGTAKTAYGFAPTVAGWFGSGAAATAAPISTDFVVTGSGALAGISEGGGAASSSLSTFSSALVAVTPYLFALGAALVVVTGLLNTFKDRDDTKDQQRQASESWFEEFEERTGLGDLVRERGNVDKSPLLRGEPEIRLNYETGGATATSRGFTTEQSILTQGSAGFLFSSLFKNGSVFGIEGGDIGQQMGQMLSEYFSRQLLDGGTDAEVTATIKETMRAAFEKAGISFTDAVVGLADYRDQLRLSESTLPETFIPSPVGDIGLPHPEQLAGAKEYGVSVAGLVKLFEEDFPAGVQVGLLALQAFEKDGVSALSGLDKEGRDAILGLTKDAEGLAKAVASLDLSGYELNPEAFEDLLATAQKSVETIGPGIQAAFDGLDPGTAFSAITEGLGNQVQETLKNAFSEKLLGDTGIGLAFQPVFAKLDELKDIDIGDKGALDAFLNGEGGLIAKIIEGKENLREYIPIIQEWIAAAKEADKIIEEATKPSDEEIRRIQNRALAENTGASFAQNLTGSFTQLLSQATAIALKEGSEAGSKYLADNAGAAVGSAIQAAMIQVFSVQLLAPLLAPLGNELAYIIAAANEVGWADPRVQDAWNKFVEHGGEAAEQVMSLIQMIFPELITIGVKFDVDRSGLDFESERPGAEDFEDDGRPSRDLTGPGRLDSERARSRATRPKAQRERRFFDDGPPPVDSGGGSDGGGSGGGGGPGDKPEETFNVNLNFGDPIAEFLAGGSIDDLEDALEEAAGQGILAGLLDGMLSPIIEAATEKIGKLVKAALADGVITDEERAGLVGAGRDAAAEAKAAAVALQPVYAAIAEEFGIDLRNATNEAVVDGLDQAFTDFLAGGTIEAFGEAISTSLDDYLRQAIIDTFLHSPEIEHAAEDYATTVSDALEDGFIDAAESEAIRLAGEAWRDSLIRGGEAARAALEAQGLLPDGTRAEVSSTFSGAVRQALAEGANFEEFKQLLKQAAYEYILSGIVSAFIDTAILGPAIDFFFQDVGIALGQYLRGEITSETFQGILDGALGGFLAFLDSPVFKDAWDRIAKTIDDLRDTLGITLDKVETTAQSVSASAQDVSAAEDRTYERIRGVQSTESDIELSIFGRRGGFHTEGYTREPFTLPALAEGGLVTRSTLALIGEGGPELVIPLSRLGAGRGDGNSELIAEVKALRAEVRSLRERAVVVEMDSAVLMRANQKAARLESRVSR